MPELRREDVSHLAMLARIQLTESELDALVGELGGILDAVASVRQAPTEGVEPMSHPLPLVNVFRDDVVTESLAAAAALAAAPEQDDQRFLVPRILVED